MAPAIHAVYFKRRNLEPRFKANFASSMEEEGKIERRLPASRKKYRCFNAPDERCCWKLKPFVRETAALLQDDYFLGSINFAGGRDIFSLPLSIMDLEQDEKSFFFSKYYPVSRKASRLLYWCGSPS